MAQTAPPEILSASQTSLIHIICYDNMIICVENTASIHNTCRLRCAQHIGRESVSPGNLNAMCPRIDDGLYIRDGLCLWISWN